MHAELKEIRFYVLTKRMLSKDKSQKREGALEGILANSALFTPFSIKTLHLPNRIVMAPMTRNFSPGGTPGSNVAAYYERRAKGGVALIVTEGTVINHPVSAPGPNVPRIFGSEALAGWRKVVKGVHDSGGQIISQLWHVGMAREAGSEPNPSAPSVGPSGLSKPGEKKGEPLSSAEIEELVMAYAQAALDAKRVGFDGIELHGAHGYLIDQFFWGGTNLRSDRYGGDLVARTQFAVEIISACRDMVGPDFPIVLRFSQWKLKDYGAKLVTTPKELESFLTPLSEAGVDIFHCSTRRYWEAEFEGSHLNLAGWTKKITGKPTITVGSVGLDTDFISTKQGRDAKGVGLDEVIKMLDRKEVDLVAVGRALLADPNWSKKVKDGRVNEITPYTAQSVKELQ